MKMIKVTQSQEIENISEETEAQRQDKLPKSQCQCLGESLPYSAISSQDPGVQSE